MYFGELSDGSFIYLLLYVNDKLVACKSKAKMEKSKTQLSNEFQFSKFLPKKKKFNFQTKDLAKAKKILGIEIVRDRVHSSSIT